MAWLSSPASRRFFANIFAKYPDRARPPRQQPDDRAQQDRLAAARCADQADDLAPVDVQRKVIEHGLRPEADHEVADADRQRPFIGVHGYIPIDAKNTANSPSSTMTRKMAFTTEVVVCKPSDSALPLTRSPSLHATTPITSAMNGALMMPTLK